MKSVKNLIVPALILVALVIGAIVYFAVDKYRNNQINETTGSGMIDVVYFNSDELRDAWFDKQAGTIQPLLTKFNKTPETNIQLPIPYNDAYKYNYAVIDMPMQTSEAEPIDYENKIKDSDYYVYL